MKVKMQDIADACGVSKSLVSRIISEDISLKIPLSTRNKVLEEVHRSGYIPDHNAQAMARKTTSKATSNITISCVTFTSNNMFGHPYFSHIMQGVMDEVEENTCELVATLSFKELSELFDLKKFDLLPKTDGLIIFGWDGDKALMQALKQYTKYVVCMNGHFDDEADFVGSSINKTLSLGIEHLVKLGYNDIGLIIGENKENSTACLNVLHSYAIKPNNDWIVQGKYTSDVTYEKIKDLLKEKHPPRAFFAMNDEMAIGCMEAISEFGYKIPQDVAIVGHDDISMARYARVPLTTVRIYKEQIGRLAVRTLIDRVKSRRKIPICVEVPGKLVIRDSCGARSSSNQVSYNNM